MFEAIKIVKYKLYFKINKPIAKNECAVQIKYDH